MIKWMFRLLFVIGIASVLHIRLRRRNKKFATILQRGTVYGRRKKECIYHVL